MKTTIEKPAAAMEQATGQITTHLLQPYREFPNNIWPLIVYHNGVAVSGDDPAARFETTFQKHQWTDCWRNGIYDYHHFHSTSHEVLGIYAGSAKVQFGGPEGVVLEVKAGDVIVIPAGVAHKNLGSSQNFGVVGAYPDGSEPDMNYAKPEEHPRVDQQIRQVPLPSCDPVYGPNGPLFRLWTKPVTRI
jgi:uncharacterized protein YjlB